MKFCCFLFGLFCISNRLCAQQPIPAFGHVLDTEFQVHNFGLDKGPDAIKLLDLGTLYYLQSADEQAPFRAIYERRIKIRILKESGIHYGNVKIPVYTNNNSERILKVTAYSYQLSGGQMKKQKVSKTGMYKRVLNKYWSEFIIVFPDVKPGTILEYKYTLQQKSVAAVKDWYFQDEVPTVYSEYQVRIPQNFHFTIHPLVVDSMEMKEETYTESRTVKGTRVSIPGVQKTFIMRNLPAVGDEPHMSSRKDYLQRISFLLSDIDNGAGTLVYLRSSWEDVVAELTADPGFGGQLITKVPAAATLLKTAKKILSENDRLLFLYDYIKKNFTWNGHQTVYPVKTANATFISKVGNSADINLLLICLLKQAGLHATPALFSTRNNGLVNNLLPSINQFNCLVGVVELDKRKLFLDATQKDNDHRLVPKKILHTKGFLLSGPEGDWITAADSINAYGYTTALSGEINEQGVLRGEVLVTAGGYARPGHYPEWNSCISTGEKLTWQQSNDLLQITNKQLINADSDTLPLELKMNFQVPLGAAGEIKYFNLNNFTDLQNDFTAPFRKTDIDFGYTQHHAIFGNYNVTSEYSIEGVPEDISLIMPDTSIIFSRFIITTGNSINVRMTVAFKRFYFNAGEYPEVSSFYKLLLSKLNEPIILKKKTTP